MIKINLEVLLSQKSKQEGRVISLSVVSREAGIDLRTLKKYQAGRVRFYTLKTIDKLCEYFGCQVGDVLRMT
jgi:putative transcriptional regulator